MGPHRRRGGEGRGRSSPVRGGGPAAQRTGEGLALSPAQPLHRTSCGPPPLQRQGRKGVVPPQPGWGGDPSEGRGRGERFRDESLGWRGIPACLASILTPPPHCVWV